MMFTDRLLKSIATAQQPTKFIHVKQFIFKTVNEEIEIYKSDVINLCREMFNYISRKQIHLIIKELIRDKYICSKNDLLDMRKIILVLNPTVYKID